MACIDLSGRRVLLTGGARGLGAAFVPALVEAGARVVFGDRLLEPGRALAAQLGPAACFLPVDLCDPDAIEAFVSHAAQHLGGLDAVINNAAITDSGGRPAEALSLATWERVMQVNLRAPWLVANAALAHLRRSDCASVVNIASDTALWGAPLLAAYVASKGGLIALGRSLAREYGPYGITVNTLAPGLTETESTAYVPPQRHAYYRQGRAITQPQTCADLIGPLLFLLSDAARYVTGQLLPVNGGFVMP